MSWRWLLQSWRLDRSRGSSTRPRPRRVAPTNYNRLEARQLLAGIVFEAATGDLYVAGTSGNDVGSAEPLAGDRTRFNLSGFASETYANSEINQIVFLGFGGDDRFTNDTNLTSLQIGGDGNDTLTGGSNFDQINGGRGSDVIAGREGDDRLIGSDGDDDISGGQGDDSVFGTAGLNDLRGDEGNDTIFGGDEADTINGGLGVDRIYALGGDDHLDSGGGGVPGSSGIDQADLILGLDGNDTFTGDDGLSVFYGGNGDDTLLGGNGENRMHGQDGADTLVGGSQSDFLNGGNGNDDIRGNDGADYILTGEGADFVNGGNGNDITVFTGTARQYRINETQGLTVRDMRDIATNQGTDLIESVERFKFADGIQAAESPIEQRVTIRPIVVSDSDGQNTAVYFGNASQELEIQAQIDDIFYQANIDIAWESTVGWNNTFANRGDRNTRPQSDLFEVTSSGDAAGAGSSNPLVLDMYLVNVVAGYGQTAENQVNGLAFVNASGIMIHVGDSLPGSSNGRKVIARVVAHEIAHNLGLRHVNDNDNLMDDGTELTASQINTVLDSAFSVVI